MTVKNKMCVHVSFNGKHVNFSMSSTSFSSHRFRVQNFFFLPVFHLLKRTLHQRNVHCDFPFHGGEICVVRRISSGRNIWIPEFTAQRYRIYSVNRFKWLRWMPQYSNQNAYRMKTYAVCIHRQHHDISSKCEMHEHIELIQHTVAEWLRLSLPQDPKIALRPNNFHLYKLYSHHHRNNFGSYKHTQRDSYHVQWGSVSTEKYDTWTICVATHRTDGMSDMNEWQRF